LGVTLPAPEQWALPRRALATEALGDAAAVPGQGRRLPSPRRRRCDAGFV